MTAPEVVITVVLVGVFHLAIGLLLGWQIRQPPSWFLKREIELTTTLSALREALIISGMKDLTGSLEALLQLRGQQRHGTGPNRDHPREGAAIEQAIDAIQRSLKTMENARSDFYSDQARARHASLDKAGLAGKEWFPSVPLEVPSGVHESRQTRRFPFPAKQQIAPVGGDLLPERSSYFEVQFRDISTGGFSFYMPNKPAFQRLAADLGMPPNIVPVLAEIVHVAEILSDEATMFLVGCRIVKRLEADRES